jgi:hypothetical protein
MGTAEAAPTEMKDAGDPAAVWADNSTPITGGPGVAGDSLHSSEPHRVGVCVDAVAINGEPISAPLSGGSNSGSDGALLIGQRSSPGGISAALNGCDPTAAARISCAVIAHHSTGGRFSDAGASPGEGCGCHGVGVAIGVQIKQGKAGLMHRRRYAHRSPFI